jgi:membrane protein implicated in regulation of membrane protease activity
MIGTVLVVAEFAVPGIVLVFFGISAWLVAGLAALLAPVRARVPLQVGLWVALSLVLLFTLRSWLQGMLRGFTAQQDDLTKRPREAIGARVEVVEPIDEKTRMGRVRWKGSLWRARADEPIAAGTIVEIVEQDNVTLTVKRGE